MIQCIILDEKGSEVSRETKPKRYVPRNGFLRGPDGNFYKQMGSAFIISDLEKTDQERQKAQAEQELKEETGEEYKQGGYDHTLGLHILHPTKKITFKELKGATSWTSCTRSSNQVTLDEVKFDMNILHLPDFDIWNTYKSVQINFKANLIKVWHKKPKNQEPDHYVIKPFFEADAQSNCSVVA